jgi:hypothetical protein
VKLVFVSHPHDSNARPLAKRWVAWVAETAVPVADWIILAEVWDAGQRDRYRALAAEWVRRCDELWLVGGRITDGMRAEVEAAQKHGVAVVDLTHLGSEPPISATPS